MYCTICKSVYWESVMMAIVVSTSSLSYSKSSLFILELLPSNPKRRQTRYCLNDNNYNSGNINVIFLLSLSHPFSLFTSSFYLRIFLYSCYLFYSFIVTHTLLYVMLCTVACTYSNTF